MTQDNEHELPDMLRLMDEHDIDRFYFSHLNYAGRGNIHRKDDSVFAATRRAMDLLFDTCWRHAEQGSPKEFVSGNNDADGVYLLLWVKKNFPDMFDHMQAKLVQWGGNATGVNIANIDNLGNVHPDTMWWNYTLGNVRERAFSEIWPDTSDPLMAGLKQRPRPVKGRCGRCSHLDICNGNTRVRAYQLTGDFWAEDPGCYLSDEEIGVAGGEERLKNIPYIPQRLRKAG
jgi:radical SAM protein with 4Fe4S-binding SPASM domain